MLVAQQLIDSFFQFEYDIHLHSLVDLHLISPLLFQVFYRGSERLGNVRFCGDLRLKEMVIQLDFRCLLSQELFTSAMLRLIFC